MNKLNTIIGSLSIGILLMSLSSCSEVKAEEEVKKFPKVRKGIISVNTLDHWVELQGSIESPNDVMLTPVMGGIVKRLYVSEGDIVKKGKLIASIDNDAIASNIQEAQEAADIAEYNYRKQQDLREAGVGTEFNTKNAFDQWQLAKRRKQTLIVQLGKAGVYAPFDGVINTLYASEGAPGGPQAPICHIVGLEKLVVTANVSELYFDKIKVGSDVEIIISSLDTTMKGLKIDRVGKYINPANRTFKIYIDIENPNERIIPNLVARVRIKDASFPRSTLVSNRAIQYDKNGGTYIYKLFQLDSTYVSELVRIQPIGSNGMYTAVQDTDELTKGDAIVIEGGAGIEDKDTVMLLK